MGSVLDLFAGRPSLPKLRLWADDATFEDNITVSKGRKQYEAQWVGRSFFILFCNERGHELE